ncbi:transcription antitermination factor NusB [Candidatus Desantisbacteria bacterium]|nr:transcription antitermination factor NusB [Candidatus Desantisbacteria bacterium]
MTNRRKSRILTMHMLYQIDTGEFDHYKILNDFKKELKYKQEIKDFAVILFTGTVAHKEEIDEVIKNLSSNWPLSRMAYIDRNILRLAIYEIMFLPEIPKNVAINEAIEIVKKYSTEESGKFINGILDKVEKKII